MAPEPSRPGERPAEPDGDFLRTQWIRTLGEGTNPRTASPSLSYRPRRTNTPGGVTSTPGSASSLGLRPPRAAPSGAGPTLSKLRVDARLVPGFELLDEIGRGGMGVVYRALQQSLDREVALKMIIDPAARDATAERFFTEAMITGFLEHPNIVPVYDVGETRDGRCYLAMKLVEGRSWRQALRAREVPETLVTPIGDDESITTHDGDEPRQPRLLPAPPPADLDRNLRILLDVCDAVAFAHSRGVIHRDLKPSNVMVGEFGEVLLMDWGIAMPSVGNRTLEDLDSCEPTFESPSGTPVYMAPELALGQVHLMGPWTDVYLLGAILYELLTGRPPHDHPTLPDAVDAAARSDPPRFDPVVPKELAALVEASMTRRPQDRITSVEEFRHRLDAHLKHRESILIAEPAANALRRATSAAAQRSAAGRGSGRAPFHEPFAEAIAGFTQALTLWPENPAAKCGLADARVAFAEAALNHGDLGLAEAQTAVVEDPARRATLESAVARARTAAARRARTEYWLRRALAGAVLSIVIGLTVGIVLLAREQDATRDALERETTEHGRAEARFNDIRGLAKSLLFEIHDAVEKLPGATPARELIVQRALEYLDRLNQSTGDDERLLAEMATAYERVAGVQALYLVGNLGHSEAALESLERSQRIRKRIVELTHGSADAQGALAAGRTKTAEILLRLGKLTEARHELDLAILELEATRETRTDHAQALSDLARAYARHSALERDTGAMARAVADQRHAVALHAELSRFLAKTADVDTERDEIEAIAALAELLRRSGDAQGSWTELKRAIEMARSLVTRSPNDAAAQRTLAGVLESAERTARQAADRTAGIAYQIEALAIRERLREMDPRNVQAMADLGGALAALGDAHAANGDDQAALDVHKRWLAAATAWLEADPGNVGATRDVRLAYERIGNDYLGLGRIDEAVATYREQIANAERRAQAAPGDARAQFDLANGLTHLGTALRVNERVDEAAAAMERADGLWSAIVAADPTHGEARHAHTVCVSDLAEIRYAQDRFADAIAGYTKAISVAAAGAAAAPTDGRWLRSLLIARVGLSKSCLASGKVDEAVEAGAAAMKDAERFLGVVPENADTLAGAHRAVSAWGMALAKADRAEEAVGPIKARIDHVDAIAAKFTGDAKMQRLRAVVRLDYAETLRNADRAAAARDVVTEALGILRAIEKDPQADALKLPLLIKAAESMLGEDPE